MDWALCFEKAEYDAREIAGRIGEQRAEMADGKGDKPGDDSRADERRNIEKQLEAQGVITRKENDD